MKRLFRSLSGRLSVPRPAGGLKGWRRAPRPWLLLAWDIAGMKAAVMEGGDGVAASAASSKADFAAALDDVLSAFAAQGIKKPKRAALAARHVLPALVDLPVAPDKPRPPAQMRELVHADLEPVLAEFGSLWTLGALFQARGHLSADDRDRVSLEEALRREGRHTPLRYGETALELDLIDRPALDQCLDLQARLQHLDSSLVAGWNGRLEDNQPLWLACGVGATLHRQWQEALEEHGIALEACLPFAWLAGEGEPEGGGKREGSCVALELHREEVVAVHRRHGRVLAARSESRLERPLQPDWLARLVADWASESRITLELVCLHPEDAEAAAAIADDLALCTGHPTRLRRPDSAWEQLWRHLAREAQAAAARLPRILARDLKGSPWQNPDVLRLAGLGALVLILVLVEATQQYRAYRVTRTMDEKARLEKEKHQNAQHLAKFNAELEKLAKDLDATRRDLEPLLNDRERLGSIAAMRQYLPELLLTLARAVGDDAVLNRVGNSSVGSNATSIRVEAWSPSYTGAQAFVSRMAELSAGLRYGVSQTEIVERKGRNGKPGHDVSFWLVPEGDDLEAAAPAPQPAPGLTTPNPGLSAARP